MIPSIKLVYKSVFRDTSKSQTKGVIIINREERRNNKPQLTEAEKIEKRLKAWVKTWNFEQKKLFEKMVENEVNKIEDLTEQVLNESFGVAIKDAFEELTVEEINKILINANEYIEDYKK